MDPQITVHKSNANPKEPLVSVVLLDCSVRERFHALDWLNKHDAPRDAYELIWLELYSSVPPAAMEMARWRTFQ